MSKPRLKMIMNPNADMGNAWKLASALRPIVEEFGGADWTGTVYPTHGIELATQAANEGYRSKYARLVGQIPNVKRVVNEVQIGPDVSISQQTSDTWITSKAKTQLFKIKIPGFDPSRVKVVTEDGVVYLMGIVTPQEANIAVEKVRYLRGVKQVVKVFEYI